MTQEEPLTTFFDRYYSDEMGALADGFPKDKASVWVDWGDLYQYDASLADEFLADPGMVSEQLSAALDRVDVPVDIDLSDATVRVANLPENELLGVGDIRRDNIHRYVGLTGHISRVTPVRPKITEAAFRCTRCEVLTRVPQPTEDFQEPHQCRSCERSGPFDVDYQASTFVDRRKVQLKQPPEQSESGEGSTIAVYCEGDVADPREITLESRVGEDVVAYGILDIEHQGSNRNKKSVFDPYLDASVFEFERETDDVDISAHKDEFTEAANSPNAYQKFIDSMSPDIYPYGRWPLALRLGAAFLMGGVRVSPEDGSTYRGDIHMGVIGPPGIGKSKFSQNIEELSPGCEHRSATGLSSDVGLTAAAVQDDFADGDGWVLKPGILPRASDHVVLDEADKTGADLSKMNDALEGEQMASIDKGGINAKLKTRVGLLAMANPEGGRWDKTLGVKEQVNIEESLWSRFDGIVLLEDQPDEEQDDDLAEHVLNNYQMNLSRQEDDDEAEDVDRPVSWDAMKAWVKYAREEITPRLSPEAFDMLREYYVDIRNDESFAENSHPTARKLEAGIRFSSAFAKIRLSETVEACDVDMAIDLSKSLLGQTLDGGELDADVFTEAEERSQKKRKERVRDAISDKAMTPNDIAEAVNADVGRVKDDLEHWYRRTNPALVTKNGDEYRWVG